ncbi:MAG TPA: protein kinase [Ktedonobacterales bacterium]|nr:protein kinase [Ktedonobacterales bacterium]
MRWNNLIGQKVGPYQVIEGLGEGGTARVYRALDETQARFVALKALPLVSDDRTSFMQRFRREVEAIRALHHPNIVEVYDSGETDEFVYLVLRYLGGRTLRDKIASQRLSTQDVCLYMIQIAHALQHAHQQGIIHRDVKPSNMLLDSDQPGTILLSDFGTAKILNAQGLTKTGAAVGTPEYMSPEQAQGQEVDQRSDIYSLGCAMYEALAGRPPFLGATTVSVLYQQVHAQPTYIRSYNTETPRELWDVLRRSLAKRPDDRYGSAKSFAEALQPFAEGLIQPTPAPWGRGVTGRPVTGRNTDSTGRPMRGTPSVPMPFPLTPSVAPGMAETARQSAQKSSQAQASESAGPFPLPLGEKRAPNSRPTFGPKGAEPSFTLRAKPTNSGRAGLSGRSGPLTPEERQVVAAWEKLVAEEPHAPASEQPLDETYQLAPPPALYPDVYPTVPTPIAPQRAPTSGPRRAPTSGPYRAPTSGPYRAPTSGPYRAPTSGPYRAPTSGPYRAPTSGPYSAAAQASVARARVTTRPVEMGGLRADIDLSTLGVRRTKRRSPVALGAALLALILLSVALGYGGVKLFAHQSTRIQATPRPTVTTVVHPTATATTTQPTPTATPSAQQLLDRQAAAAFRAITIAPFSDSACSSASMTTRLSGPVYINLCMANSRAPGPVTVAVRHNGAVVRTLISNLYPSAGAYYTQGHTLGAGSYDMLVTMQINGKQAVARDIAFTVS